MNNVFFKISIMIFSLSVLLANAQSNHQSITNNNPIITTKHPYHNEQLTNNFRQNFDKQLTSDEYSTKKEIRQWIKQEKIPEPDIKPDFGFFDWLNNLSDLFSNFAKLISFLLKAALMIGLILFFWWLYKRRGVFTDWANDKFGNRSAQLASTRQKRQKTEPLAEDDVLVGQIKQALEKGDYLLAVSLLYRSSLRAMSIGHELTVKKSDTENKCRALLAGARTHYAGELPFFDKLVITWQQLAYGVDTPTNIQTISEQLFVDWKRIYASRLRKEISDE